MRPPKIYNSHNYKIIKQQNFNDSTSICQAAKNQLCYNDCNMNEFLIPRKIFELIISGGQTGADQGALDAALKLNHPCGGYCPKGRKSEKGAIPHYYPMQELRSANYPPRTKANVKRADGTLIFTYGPPSGGTLLTLEYARKLQKPFYIIEFYQNNLHQTDLQKPDIHKNIEILPQQIREWGEENRIYILNVAGPRESEHPGTQKMVAEIICALLNQ